MSQKNFSLIQTVVILTAIITSILVLSQLALANEVLTFSPHLKEINWSFFEQYRDNTLDVDKLCRAIAVAETSGCTDGTAIKRKNCHGIMAWKKEDGKIIRYPRYFKSHAESQAACVDLWSRKYERFPDIDLAKLWTGNDKAETWLSIVVQKYDSF